MAKTHNDHLPARLSAIGSALAIVLFCGTLSYLLTTPSVVSF